MRFCTPECGDVEEHPEDESKNSCAYCRGERITDIDLLNYLLEQMKLSKGEATLKALKAKREQT